jgi:hypothetical protein
MTPTSIEGTNPQTAQPTVNPTPLPIAPPPDALAASSGSAPSSPPIPIPDAVPPVPISLPIQPAISIEPAPITADQIQGVGTLELLTEAEMARLRACEGNVLKSCISFVDAGLALAAIKNEELYRDGFDSFETYCRVRWGFQMSKVYNWMTAAKLFSSLSTRPDLPKPEYEAQLRPLFGLAPSQAQLAWQCAAAMRPGHPVTTRMVKTAIKQLQLVPPKPAPRRINKGEQRRLVTDFISELLVLARQQAAHAVLIEKIEGLDPVVFGRAYASDSGRGHRAEIRRIAVRNGVL